MLDFSDKPYQFFPPKPNWLVTAIVKQLNRRFVLPGRKHRIKEIQLRHADRIVPIIESNARCMFLPNHSTHSDPQLMLEVQRRLRVSASMMAAYDVFLRSKRNAWLMQRIGCFSVDREGSDKQAMNCAVDLLIRGDRALTIFPEGNVFLMNDRVSPFLGGATFLAMRAQKKLGPDKPIYGIPISLGFTHLTDCRAAILRHVADLESRLSIEPDHELTIRQRLRRIGIQVLSRNLRQRGFIPPASEEDDLNKLLEESALQIITRLEQKIELDRSAGDPPMERIRRIRAAIHQVRIDREQHLDHRVAASWADEAILAMRILSYSGDYLRESPTLDRHSETLEKLREDLVEEIVFPIGDRKAVVHFGQPVNFAKYLDAKNSKDTLAGLTRHFEQVVQHGLDEISRENSSPGSELLE